MGYTITKADNGKVSLANSNNNSLLYLPTTCLPSKISEDIVTLKTSEYKTIQSLKVSEVDSVVTPSGSTSPTTATELITALDSVFRSGGSSSSTTKQGWENIEDDNTTSIVVSDSPVKLTFNGLGSNTNLNYRPQGNEMYNTTTQRFTPVNIGDAGELRVYMKSVTLSGNPTRIDLIFDIGTSDASPLIPIYEHSYTLKSGNVQPLSMHFSWFQLGTFLNNGGQIFAVANSGTVTIGQRSIFNKKDMDGADILNSQP